MYTVVIIMDENEDYFDDVWNVYFHDPVDKDWTFKSYALLNTISSPAEYWMTHAAITPERLHLGMFFLIREHIYPCWDDPSNKDGGCYSIKVPRLAVDSFWQKVCALVLTESIDLLEVNGLSISPKGQYCIVKLWTGQKPPSSAAEAAKLVADLTHVMPHGFVGSIVWRSWME
jgi:hypothetical protein